MNHVKRTGLGALLVVVVMLLASRPARASESWELANVCDSGDQDGDATGQVTYGDNWKIIGYDKFGTIWGRKLSISCQNLTPRATYSTPVGTSIADRNGTVKANGWAPVSNWGGAGVRVERLTPEGSWVTVLSG